MSDGRSNVQTAHEPPGSPPAKVGGGVARRAVWAVVSAAVAAAATWGFGELI